MGRDPLDQFRRQPEPNTTRQPQAPQQARPAAPAMEEEPLEPPRRFDPRTGKEVYQPFQISSRKRDRLIVRPDVGQFVHPRYFDMADIITDRDEGKEIVLPFPLYTVFIEGRNLQQLMYALNESRSRYIEAYNPDKHAPVPDDDQSPFIKSIRIALKNRQAAEEPAAEPKGHTVS